MGVPKTSDYMQIRIRMPNPSHKPPASSKAPNQDLKDMDVLCTFKMKIKAKICNMALSKTSEYIIVKIKMPNPSLEPPASSTASNEDLKYLDVLCTFKINIESQNLDHEYI